MRTTFNPFTGKLDYIGTSGGSTSTNPFSGYSVSNLTSDFTFDADNTSLDEMANIIGTLLNLLKTGVNLFDPTDTSLDEIAQTLYDFILFTTSSGAVATSAFTPVNVTTDRIFDASNTSLDELADVVGTLMIDLAVTGTTTQIYIVSNVTTDTIFDATDTSLDELANVFGSMLKTLQSVGRIQ